MKAGKAAAAVGYGMGPDFSESDATDLITVLRNIRADQGDPV